MAIGNAAAASPTSNPRSNTTFASPTRTVRMTVRAPLNSVVPAGTTSQRFIAVVIVSAECQTVDAHATVNVNST